MGATVRAGVDRGSALSRALKALRRRRDLPVARVAAEAGMKLRSYQHFEAGRTRVNVERVHRIARGLNADPYAILAAVELGSPEFAVRAADNKLMTILMMSLKDFDSTAGDRILLLDARLISTVFERAFAELAGVASERFAAATQWSPPPLPPTDEEP